MSYKFIMKLDQDIVHAMPDPGLRTLCGRWVLWGYETIEEGVHMHCEQCIEILCERIPGLLQAIKVEVQR